MQVEVTMTMMLIVNQGATRGELRAARGSSLASPNAVEREGPSCNENTRVKCNGVLIRPPCSAGGLVDVDHHYHRLLIVPLASTSM